jgi:hypothetical protein
LLDILMKKTTFRGARLFRKVKVSAYYSFALYALFAITVQFSDRIAFAGDTLSKQITINILANTSLDDALIEWGIAAGMTVMIDTRTVEHKLTVGVHGALRADDALLILLRGSGLSYTVEGERVRVVSRSSLVRSADKIGQPESPSQESDFQGTMGASEASELQNKPALDSTGTGSEARRGQLDVIVVTAQKRTENLQDVPIPVSAVNARDSRMPQCCQYEALRRGELSYSLQSE